MSWCVQATLINARSSNTWYALLDAHLAQGEETLARRALDMALQYAHMHMHMHMYTSRCCRALPHSPRLLLMQSLLEKVI